MNEVGSTSVHFRVERDLRLYERLDALLKGAAFTATLALLLWIRTVRFASYFAAVLIGVKISGWALRRLLMVCLKRFAFGMDFGSSPSVDANKKIGQYSIATIQKWADEIAAELGILHPVRAFSQFNLHALTLFFRLLGWGIPSTRI